MNDILMKIAAAIDEEKSEKKDKDTEKKDKKGVNPFAKKAPGDEDEAPAGKEGEKPEGDEAPAIEASEENGEVSGQPGANEGGEIPAEGEEVPVEGEEQMAGGPMAGGTPDVSMIVDFFQNSPNPDDATYHQFAEGNGWDINQAEGIAYALATRFVNLLRGGLAAENEFTIDMADPNELQMGIEIEYEHTPDASVAKKIALDHLAKIPDYYTRLQQMESSASSEVGAAVVPENNKSLESDDGYTQEESNQTVDNTQYETGAR